jgi:hypothetical protein
MTLSNADYAEIKRRLAADVVSISVLHVTGDMDLNSLRPRNAIILQGNTGTVGQVVASQGPGKAPAWAAGGGGGGGTLTGITAGTGIAVTGSAPSPTVSLTFHEALTVIASSVASQALNLSLSPVFDVTLAVATTTFSFTNPATSGLVSSFTLWLRQDGTGSRAVVWPAAVKWPSGVAPVISSGVNKMDIYVFSTGNGGTTWYGMTAAQDLR